MSSNFYTFVGEMDNAIFHRYYNENKEEVFEKIDKYNYTLYVEHPSGDSKFKTLNGKALKEIVFHKPRDMKRFYRENKDLMKIHGNDSAVHQFIAKEYPYDVKQTCPVKILNFDIEVEHSEGFPDPVYANQEIMSISVKQFGSENKFYSFGTKPLSEYDNKNGEYIQCKNEQELIAKFMKLWRDINPQFITGWNIDGFDIPYLLNRIKKVLGKKFVSYLSPFYDKVRDNDRLITEKINKTNKDINYSIFGITSFDYIELYKKYHPVKQESYKLDFIGEVDVGQKKVNFDEYAKSLMRLYNGDIITDMESSFKELDETMQYAVIREMLKTRLNECGYFNEFGDMVNKFELETFDKSSIEDLTNDQLKEYYNHADERVRTLSYKKFIRYNEQDANIVELIDNKMMYIKQAIRVGHMAKSRMQEIFGTVAPWDNMIYARLLAKNQQIPARESHDKSEKFAGAYVKDPILGFHKWVATVDLKSLYPSIIRMGNMSPETMRKNKDFDSFKTLDSILDFKYDTSEAKSKGWVTTANGSCYDQSFTGVIPDAMKFLMIERDVVKTKMKDVNNYIQHIKRSVEHRKNHSGEEFEQNKDYVKSYGRNKEEFATDDIILSWEFSYIETLLNSLEDEVSMLDATQLALKILANSGYGAIGNASFRYFRLEIAEGITLTGQLALRYMSQVIDDFLNEVCGTKNVIYAIYGDTDSIFICLDNWVKYMKFDESNVDNVITQMDEYMANVIEPLIANNYDKLSDYLGAKENLLIMKREALADATIFRGKKNYIMQLYDNEHVRFAEPKMKMMGVETAKSSTAMIIRNKLKECFKIVINKNTRKPSELKKLVDDFREEFDRVDVVAIASPRGVSDIDKWIDDKGNIISGCPIHVRASINYNNFIASDPKLKRKYEQIKNGSKIRFIKLKEPNLIHSYVVAFIDELPEEMELAKYINRKQQFEDTFMVPLESFTQLIDWDIRRSVSLNSLFADDGDDEVQQIIAVDKKKKKAVPIVQPKKASIDDLFG